MAELGEHAEIFYREMQKRRLNVHEHIRRILALTEIHSTEKVAAVIADGHQLGAYSSEGGRKTGGRKTGRKTGHPLKSG